MKLFYILTIMLISMNNVFSIYKPDFGRMMDQKREEIRQMRNNSIPINRTIRYSERYRIYK
jgi:hypothetical protein